MPNDKPRPLDKVKVIVDKMEIHHAIEMYQALGEYLHEKLFAQKAKTEELLTKVAKSK